MRPSQGLDTGSIPVSRSSLRKAYGWLTPQKVLQVADRQNKINEWRRLRAEVGEGGLPYNMYYVYLLQSENHPHEHYVGYSADLRQRIKAHNWGSSKHTSKFAPWKLVTYLGFANERVAKGFEWYLKTGSGRTFIKRHLLL